MKDFKIDCECCDAEGTHDLDCTTIECEACDGNGEICSNCGEYHYEDECE